MEGFIVTPRKPPTQKKLRELWQAVAMFIDKYEITSVEAIIQMDKTYLALPELAEAVCEIVGFTEGDWEDE